MRRELIRTVSSDSATEEGNGLGDYLSLGTGEITLSAYGVLKRGHAAAVLPPGSLEHESTDLSVDSLYPDLQVAPSAFSRALRLLQEAADVVDDAADALREDDFLTADDAVHHLHAITRELFALRQLNEGFALVVNGIMLALENTAGEPLVPDQLRALRTVVLTLRSHPKMSLDSAVEAVERLEEAGLSAQHRALLVLADLLELLQSSDS